MSDFMTDGAAVLPDVKSDARPASVPVGASEWAASDTNEIRQALLDLRTGLLGTQTGFVNPNVALVTATGSTTARTLAGRAGDVVNVKDFGAIGNDSADDTAAVQAAIAAATSQNGTLFFPPGTYRVYSTLTYAGTPGSAFIMSGSAAGRGASGSVLRWYGAAGGTMFKLAGANSFLMENLIWDGAESADIMVWFSNDAGAVGSSDIQVVNCKFAEGRRTAKSTGLRLGTSTFQVSEVVIDRCLFQACYYGLMTYSNNVKNFKVQGCVNTQNFWGISHGDPDTGASLSGQFLISGCTFFGNGDVASGYFGTVAGKVDAGGDIFSADATVINCETEGSSRFISIVSNVGTNPGNLVLIGNKVEGSDQTPVDDYVVKAGSSLTMIGNQFVNNRTGTSVAKVQLNALNNRYVSPYAQSAGCVSINNWFRNASIFAPLYLSSTYIMDSFAYTGEFMGSVSSYGDQGGVQGAMTSLQDRSGTGSAFPASLARYNNAASTVELSYPYTGLLSVGVNKITIPYGHDAFKVASGAAFLSCWDIPPRTKITNVVSDVTEAFTGLPGTTTLQIGDGVTENGFVLIFDIKSGTVTKGVLTADLGPNFAANVCLGGFYFWTAGYVVKAKFNSGTGNFGNGSVTNLTGGSVTIYVTVERMP